MASQAVRDRLLRGSSHDVDALVWMAGDAETFLSMLEAAGWIVSEDGLQATHPTQPEVVALPYNVTFAFLRQKKQRK